MRYRNLIGLGVSISAAILVAACGPAPRKASRWPTRPEEPVPAPRPPSRLAVGQAADACLTTVLDGRPTKADVGQAFRMVNKPSELPGTDRVWLAAYNRGGQWTIDDEGRYAPFPGIDVKDAFGLTFVSEATSRRLVAAADGNLLRFDHDLDTFVPLLRVADQHQSIRLTRIEREDLTLMIVGTRVLRLRGDRAEPWSEFPEGLTQAFDLPGLRAVLFAGGDGILRIRRDGGGWTSVGQLDHDGQRDYVERVQQSPEGETALVQLRSTAGPSGRLLALTRSKGVFGTRLVGTVDRSPDRSGPQTFYAPASDEILKFEQPNPGSPPRWSRLTAGGFSSIQGGRQPVRDGDFLRLTLTALPDRRATVLTVDEGLAIYRAGRMSLLPGPKGGLGPLPDVVDLPTIGRTLILSRNGLFELTRDDRIVRLEAPFSTGGLPPPLIFNDPRRQAATISAREGLFLLKRDGRFERVRGGSAPPNFGDERVASLPLSGDVLLELDNALWLLVSPGSPRWRACAAHATTAPSPP
ncbi:hypothetical protein [Caulobacter segnis]